MLEKRIGALCFWFFESFLEQEGICHFVSDRRGGFSEAPYDSLNLAFHVGDDPEKVIENRRLVARSLGIPLSNFTFAKQVHGANVKIITEEFRGRGAIEQETAIDNTDAMITAVPNICLTVLSADCVPILFYDPRKRVVGVAHAGWRGTAQLIAKKTVRMLKEEFNCQPSDILVGIGPSIGPCCYEVGEDVIFQMERVLGEGQIYIEKGPVEGKGFLNLWEANKRQILEEGIPEGNIEIAKVCTYCNAGLFFSGRYGKGKTGRFGTGIMIR